MLMKTEWVTTQMSYYGSGKLSVVWVLGAAGGVGSVVCQNLSKQGWKVVGSGRTEESLQALTSQIDNLDILPVDARDDDAMKQAVADIIPLRLRTRNPFAEM